MNKKTLRIFSIFIIACMCFTGTVSFSFADEKIASAEAVTEDSITEKPTVSLSSEEKAITARIFFTYSSYAKNTKKLGEVRQKDNFLTLKWTLDDPFSYDLIKIYRISRSSGKAGCIKTYSYIDYDKTSYSYVFLGMSGSFDYEVRAYADSTNLRDYDSARVSAPKIASGYLTTTTVKKNLWWSAEAKKTIKLYKSPGKSVYTKVSKGTDMTATWEYSPKKFDFWSEPSWVQVNYKGKKLWAKWSQVKMHWHITHKDYAWSIKEKFVNSTCKGKSKTKYLIWVSRYTQRTNVFKKKNGKWKLIKVYNCNTGNYYQPLKGGQYYIKGHSYRVNKIHRSGRAYYFLYSTKFGGSGTFHTRCKWSDNGHWRNAIKRHPTTKGCDRLYNAAAKYIYNLPNGTGVLIK